MNRIQHWFLFESVLNFNIQHILKCSLISRRVALYVCSGERVSERVLWRLSYGSQKETKRGVTNRSCGVKHTADSETDFKTLELSWWRLSGLIKMNRLMNVFPSQFTPFLTINGLVKSHRVNAPSVVQKRVIKRRRSETPLWANYFYNICIDFLRP